VTIALLIGGVALYALFAFLPETLGRIAQKLLDTKRPP
jgi:hypothetical protein